MSELYKGDWAPSAAKRLAILSDPAEIDKVVNFLMRTRFSGKLGTPQYLLLADRILEANLSNGLRRGLTTADNLASSLWNTSLSEFCGTTTNLRGKLVAPALTDFRLSPAYIDPVAAVSFEIIADLDSFDHRDQGQLVKRYSLYRNNESLDAKRTMDRNGPLASMQMKKSARALLDQATAYASEEDVERKPLLWLTSKLVNRDEYLDLVMPTKDRFDRLTEEAKTREFARMNHPFQAGLPSLGKG